MERDRWQDRTKEELVGELERLQQRLAALEATEAARLEAVEALKESEEKYRLLLDESSDPIFTFYPDGQYRYVNKRFAEGLGLSMQDIIGKKIWDVFSQDEADKRYAVVKWVFTHGESRVIEVRVPRPDGDDYYLTTAKPILGEGGKVLSVICISKEITERKRVEEELKRANERLSAQLAEIEALQASLREQAIRDALTGLYNWRYLHETLERELAQAAREGTPVSVVMMDIDYFKEFNDSHGHKAGDKVLRTLGKMLQAQTRLGDIACRYGGEEFVVIMPGASADMALKRAEDWRLAFAKTPVENEGRTLSATLSGGVATFPEHGKTVDDLLHAADTALYAAKAAGRNRMMLADTPLAVH